MMVLMKRSCRRLRSSCRVSRSWLESGGAHSKEPFRNDRWPRVANIYYRLCKAKGGREGLEDSAQHGLEFGRVFGDLLNFLPALEQQALYIWRFTNDAITSHMLSKSEKERNPGMRSHEWALLPRGYTLIVRSIARWSNDAALTL